jgi:hypothetical protein
MPMDDFSPHQQKIIKRYYANQDAIQTQKLAELVADLYLAEGKKRAKLWQSAGAALVKMGVSQATVDEMTAANDITRLAGIVKELFGKS